MALQPQMGRAKTTDGTATSGRQHAVERITVIDCHSRRSQPEVLDRCNIARFVMSLCSFGILMSTTFVEASFATRDVCMTFPVAGEPLISAVGGFASVAGHGGHRRTAPLQLHLHFDTSAFPASHCCDSTPHNRRARKQMSALD